MKKQCSNCKYWIPLIDNGQCNKDVKLYSEYDDCCNEYKPKSIIGESKYFNIPVIQIGIKSAREMLEEFRK